MAAWIPLIQVLVGGAAQLLESQRNKTAQDVGVDLQLADQVALAVLQKTAEVKGVQIDWTDPTAVAGYVQTLPAFIPIPDSPSVPIPDPAASKLPSPAADPAPGTTK
jgi:hypothetical protein